MEKEPFVKVVEVICGKDQRYDPEAYFFVQEALAFTAKTLEKPEKGAGRHVTGRELLDGIRTYTIREFGPMALTVLNTWGIKKTEDFGEIVFNLVETGWLGKTDQDKKEHFADGYDFVTAFAKPFQPISAVSAEGRPTPRRRSSRKGKSPEDRRES